MCYYTYIFYVDSEESQLRAKGHNQVSHTPMGGQKETVDQKSNKPHQTKPKCRFLRIRLVALFYFYQVQCLVCYSVFIFCEPMALYQPGIHAFS